MRFVVVGGAALIGLARCKRGDKQSRWPPRSVGTLTWEAHIVLHFAMQVQKKQVRRDAPGKEAVRNATFSGNGEANKYLISWTRAPKLTRARHRRTSPASLQCTSQQVKIACLSGTTLPLSKRAVCIFDGTRRSAFS